MDLSYVQFLKMCKKQNKLELWTKATKKYKVSPFIIMVARMKVQPHGMVYDWCRIEHREHGSLI